MTLPRTSLPSKTITLPSGSKLKLRGLSRGEALRMASLGEDASAIETLLIEYAAEVSEDEAKQWHNEAPSGDVQAVVEAVINLSGLDGELGKGQSGA
jgi:hypothetical protein